MKKIIICILLVLISISLMAEENYDWLTTGRFWWIEDGRELVDPKADFIYWNRPPNAKFRKLEIPPGSVLYQVQLRNELFYFLYETEKEVNKQYPIGTAIGTDPFEVEFNENFTHMARYSRASDDRRTFWGGYNREGRQENQKYPLVGIWGVLPSLNEYRLVDPSDCIYYLEIEEEIPGWAVRKGQYLLKKLKENIFETVSSFPEGCLRLEIRNEKQILLLPLFKAAKDERRRVAPLSVRRQ